MKLTMDNMVLTKGETSDVFEIYSTESLKDFTAEYRITDSEGTIKASESLKRTEVIKNNDSIFTDSLTYTLKGKEFDIVSDVEQFNDVKIPFPYEIKLTKIEKRELHEDVEFSGKVFKTEILETIKKKDEVDQDTEGEFIVEGSEYQDNDTQELMVILRKEIETGIKNCEVEVAFTSRNKETTRSIKVQTNENGEFTGRVFLGNTIKQEADQGFVFVISETITKSLDEGRYLLTINIKKNDNLGKVIFSKEIIQTKLDINKIK